MKTYSPSSTHIHRRRRRRHRRRRRRRRRRRHYCRHRRRCHRRRRRRPLLLSFDSIRTKFSKEPIFLCSPSFQDNLRIMASVSVSASVAAAAMRPIVGFGIRFLPQISDPSIEPQFFFGFVHKSGRESIAQRPSEFLQLICLWALFIEFF